MDRQEKLWVTGMMLLWIITMVSFFIWQNSWVKDAVPHYDEEPSATPSPTPTDNIGIVFIDDIPTAVLLTGTFVPPTATITPSPTVTVTPTAAQEFIATPTPISTMPIKTE